MFGLSKSLRKEVEKRLSVFTKILKDSLRVKEEDIVIVADYGREDHELSALLGYGFYRAARLCKYPVQLHFQDIKKGFMHADTHVERAIDRLNKNSIIIVVVSGKLGRLGDKKSFRLFCQQRGHRFISTTGLIDARTNHLSFFLEAMSVKKSRLKKLADVFKKKFDKGKELRVTTPAGTDITFDIDGVESITNIGEYTQKGMGGNIPAGEVYFAPKNIEGVEGVVVIDGSVKIDGRARLVSEPLRLIVKKGKVIQIEGVLAEEFEKSLKKQEERAKYPERVRYIAEFGIGINPAAVLLGSTIIDEKTLGTAHIALGSNYWFGGPIRTIFHADQVFKDPTLYVDNVKLV